MPRAGSRGHDEALGHPPTSRTASNTPGMKLLAVGRVVADRERLALAAEDHLLVGDQAGQPHRVDRLVHPADVTASLSFSDQQTMDIYRPHTSVSVQETVTAASKSLTTVNVDPLLIKIS